MTDPPNWSKERVALQVWALAQIEYERAMRSAGEAQQRAREAAPDARKYVKENGPTNVTFNASAPRTVYCDLAGLFMIEGHHG